MARCEDGGVMARCEDGGVMARCEDGGVMGCCDVRSVGLFVVGGICAG